MVLQDGHIWKENASETEKKHAADKIGPRTGNKNGDVTWMPVKSDSYFHGIEASDPGSLVAVSNDEGLVRCMHFASDSKCKALAILPNDQNNNKRFEVPNI